MGGEWEGQKPNSLTYSLPPQTTPIRFTTSLTPSQYDVSGLAGSTTRSLDLRNCRDIDEIFINNYNAEWIEAWDANLDISPVYDYFGIITYITDYFTKVITVIVYWPAVGTPTCKATKGNGGTFVGKDWARGRTKDSNNALKI